jgi:hypothetical protein
VNSESRGGAKVVWLAVHTTEGIMRVQALRDWATWPGSSHASSDETGALWGPAQGFVPYDRAAWTLRNGNHISENIEQCGWARWTRAEWLARPLLLDATARWLAERSAARGIPLVRLSAADIRAKKPGVLGHGDYSVATGDGDHSDPGPNYPWDVVLTKANAYRNGTPQEDDMELKELIDYRAQQYDGATRSLYDSANQTLANIGALSKQVADLTAAVAELKASIGQGGTGPVDVKAVADALTVVPKT